MDFFAASTAASIGFMLYFLTWLPYSFFFKDFKRMNYFTKILYCLPLNTGMSQGIFFMLKLELAGKGLNFGNLFSRPPATGFSFAEIYMVMILTATLHILLLIYIDQAFPGEFGVPKKWYFPIQPILKLFKRKSVGYQDETASLNSEHELNNSDNFEDDPACVKVGIQISNLSKYFGLKAAVKKLNLNMYEGQITALLGHNGAGKTTTMSMLTGMFKPSFGTAYIDGKDIRDRMDEARASLGLCPQHNILFDELTVEEHFKFFCQLKGIENETEIERETNKYIAMLEIEDKRNTLSAKLSGGMKRKLSVGIALCGGSKVVICDEPTSGMDSEGRRLLWDLLIEEKKNRTILLTTREYQRVSCRQAKYLTTPSLRFHG
jgi:ATP-binding cassette, subfamily A (ABC1), member 3